jgi:tRNA G18 (ribose-2'-O)-methylase SpoU
MKRGFYGIGIERGKTKTNYGTLFRTAQLLNADFVFIIGARFKKQCSDTMKSWRHIPSYAYNTFDDFNKNRPYGCKLIGIEMDKKAIQLDRFYHPKQACYLLGAEDSGLSKEALKECQGLIVLPGERSMNVAVAGSIVIYDRFVKEAKGVL